MLFSEVKKLFIQALIEKERSQGTVAEYAKDLKCIEVFLKEKYAPSLHIEFVTLGDVKAYLSMLEKTKQYQPTSCNRHLNTLRSFYKFAYNNDFVSTNVVKSISPKKVSKKERSFLTEQEFHEFAESIKHDLVQLVVRTLFYTGLRISECLSLKVKHIDFEKSTICIFNGKGNKDRLVPLNAILKVHLQDYIEKRRPSVQSEKLFVTERTGGLSDVYVNRILRETTLRLGWNKKITCHTLRHSFASALVDKNVNLVVIKELLGHADLKTTSVYSHTTVERKEEAISRLG